MSHPLFSGNFPLIPFASSSDNFSEDSFALVSVRFKELSSAFTLSNVGGHLPNLEAASGIIDLRLSLLDGGSS